MRTVRLSLIAAAIVALPLALGSSVMGQSEEPLDPIASPSATTSTAGDTLTGRLMFSRFDEATHTFLSDHTILPDGSDETVIPLPGPEGGGRWSRSGTEIAVMTILPDERVGTAIITPDGTVERVLDIPDDSLNAVCVVWSPDDSRLACEA